jgi:hypothetical protein
MNLVEAAMNAQQLPPKFSPKAMMKAWRPERFSDSAPTTDPALSRTILEYHLDTLTSRKQETEFERFALDVARHSICPNLRAQTGPTGGGDGKVDTETFPVAEQLAYAWHVGEAMEAASERWGFAFSAKKKWKPKLQSDIAKIAATDRGYRKAFFISNQLISDREASELQDSLSKAHGFDVRILGRNWLLDQVFDRKLQQMAISVLGIEVGERKAIQLGPLDANRSEQLTRLDQEIETAVREGRFGPDLVNDSLESARLARELERPRTDVDGRYDRAERLADKCGTQHQRLEVAYQRAWTAHFWHEDFDLFDRLYTVVEDLAKDSDNACHLERLNNLWYLTFTLSRLQIGNVGADKLSGRTIILANALTRLSRMEERPSSALHARSMLLLQQITATMPNTPATVFNELRDVLSQCDGLVGFPLAPLTQSIQQLGALIEDDSEYEELLEDVISLTSRHAGEVEAAMMVMRRGAQKLEKGKFYDAISLIGRSFGNLAKHETRQQLISGLNLLSHAYEQVGLLWAARGSLLSSISMILNEFEAHADTDRLRVGPISRMKWLELQLGRLTQCLEWTCFDRAVANAFADRERGGSTAEELATLDVGIAILLLRATQEQLLSLTQFPDVLDRMGLLCSRGALLCALGHDDDVHTHLAKDGDTAEDVFRKLGEQPIAADIGSDLVIDCADKTVLRSKVWGCLIQVSCPMASPYLELAESILAATEATLATAGRERIVAMASRIDLNIIETDCPWFEFNPERLTDERRCEIRCGAFDASRLRREDQNHLRERICDLVSNLLIRVFLVGDFEATAEKLFGVERGFERGTNLTTSFVTLANILSKTPRLRLADWMAGGEAVYQMRRPAPWNAFEGCRPPPRAREVPGKKASLNAEPWKGFGEIHQSQLETVSLINAPLWDSASWKATAFLWKPNDSEPPFLGFCFKNGDAAFKIFASWRTEFGGVDSKDRLRIIILRGIKRTNRFAYRVCVSANLETSGKVSDGKYLMITNRCHTMEPKDDRNLSEFLERLQRWERFGLIYAILGEDGRSMKPDFSSVILMTKLVVREAWEVGVGDVDCMAIQPDDDPIIPPSCPNPPVRNLLEWMKSNVK